MTERHAEASLSRRDLLKKDYPARFYIEGQHDANGKLYGESIRQGLPPDFDVYDATAWSAPWPLSETSVKRGSIPVKFPDFTRGGWQNNRTGV